jgi:hypothetical protein
MLMSPDIQFVRSLSILPLPLPLHIIAKKENECRSSDSAEHVLNSQHRLVWLINLGFKFLGVSDLSSVKLLLYNVGLQADKQLWICFGILL